MDLTYFLSKAFWFAARPGNVVLIVILVGTLVAWIRPAKSGRLWLTALSLVLVMVTILPVHNWISRPLEQRFPPPASLPAKVDGILVLGGFSDPRISQQSGQLAVNQSAERIMAAAALAGRFPEARVLLSEMNQAALSAWLSDVGVDRDRVTYEVESRNTFENLTLSYSKLQPGPEDVWLLITTAQHMPRAVGISRKLGWDLIPYPVDYQSSRVALFGDWPDMAENLEKVGTALKEWVGLLAYFALGQSDELFPGPAD